MPNAYQPTTDRVHEQVALNEATDGREGGTLEGRPVVVLSTIGATAGDREIPVMVLVGWMAEAGFSETYVEHLVGPDSMVVGIK
jgi:F420H(2)-dependent quinone reductase